MRRTSWHLAASAALALLALAGCGGDGGTEPDQPPTSVSDIPISATQSAEGFSDWMGTLETDDTKEALNVNGVELQSADGAEPIPVT